MKQIRKVLTVSASEDAEITAAYTAYISVNGYIPQNQYLKRIILDNVRRRQI